jgi:hypothetical protein
MCCKLVHIQIALEAIDTAAISTAIKCLSPAASEDELVATLANIGC